MSTLPAMEARACVAPSTRAVVHRTRGSTQGPITRLMRPGDLGQVLKPFIVLDLVNFEARHGQTRFGMHPYSGIATLTCLAVTLAQGERWRYTPPAGHTVAWVAVASGQLLAGEPISPGELVRFAPSETAIDFIAETDTRFVLGAAVPHPHPLVMGTYSVHTSADALAHGEALIRRLGPGLRGAGQPG